MSTLYIVATPIGNLQDVSLRALEVLKSVDLVAAEDTRVAQKLLTAHGISSRMISYHQHNADEKDPQLLELLQQGQSIAYVSDAGTPLLSDPGHSLVRICYQHDIPVTAIPGASAAMAAFSINPFNASRFSFEGFLPPKSAARCERLRQLQGETRAIILYESKHRLLELVSDMITVLGEEREIMLVRELSKLHEQVFYASLAELGVALDDGRITLKGEFVLILKGDDGSYHQDERQQQADILFQQLKTCMSQRDAVDLAQTLFKLPRNTLKMMAAKHYQVS